MRKEMIKDEDLPMIPYSSGNSEVSHEFDFRLLFALMCLKCLCVCFSFVEFDYCM